MTVLSERPALGEIATSVAEKLGGAELVSGAVCGLEGLLDAGIAGPRARAVWTGSALLVAEPERAHVAIERWECPPHPGSMRRTDVP